MQLEFRSEYGVYVPCLSYLCANASWKMEILASAQMRFAIIETILIWFVTHKVISRMEP